MRQKISQVTKKVIYLDGEATAQGLGNVRAANVVLLGALSAADGTGRTGGRRIIRRNLAERNHPTGTAQVR